MSADALVDEILSYLQAHTVMTLATCNASGPHAAAVYYANEQFDLYFVTDPETRHGSDMVADPNVAVSIQDQPFEWSEIQGIQLQGTAEQLSDDGTPDATRVFTEKFPYATALLDSGADRQHASKTDGVKMWRLRAHRVRLIDNKKGFGHREEIEIDAMRNLRIV